MKSKFKSALVLILLGLGTLGTVRAGNVTVTFAAQDPGSALGTVGGQDLQVGALVRFGFFDTLTDFNAMINDLSLLNTHFTELGKIQVGFFDGQTTYNSSMQVVSSSGGTNHNAAGAFAGKVTLDPSIGNLANTRLYMWAFDSSTIGSAQAHAIFSDNAWQFPSVGTATFSLGSASPSDINDLYFATRGPETNSSGVGGQLNKLNPVPEPGSITALTLALSTLFLRRHRRSHPL